MSYWSRIVNVFRGDRLAREIDEEIESHIAEALAQGRDPAEARRAFGPALKIREHSQDVRIAARLDALRADTVFACRQLRKTKVTSAAAILSLALAMGSCLAVFRLLDAVVFRSLPVANPGGLFVLTFPVMNAAGEVETADWFDYPQFRKLRAAVKGDADLIAIAPPGPADVTFETKLESEQLHLQFISGWMFGSFGLKPALGRLLTETDDLTPGANAVAVLSWAAWDRRFGRDPSIIGRRFQFHDSSYEIVGVSEKGFTGTEPGTMSDLFVPTMMKGGVVDQAGLVWFRIWVHLRDGASREAVRQKLKAAEHADRLERAKSRHGDSPERLRQYLASELFLEPAAGGFSLLQRQYRRPLTILGFIVAMVLLIACVNVANLMLGRAQARAGEMALRVSIGAGRLRLIQLVLVESALIGLLACGLGSLLAALVAPFMIRQVTPVGAAIDLSIVYDWRVSVFSAALLLFTTLSFGGIPALRASAITPGGPLRRDRAPGERRLMNTLVGVQAAFCVLVLLVAGLFASSFHRLASKPLGLDPEGIINLNAVTRQHASLEDWEQVRSELERVPGVSSAAISTWALMSPLWWSEQISVDGAPPLNQEAYFLATSPEWLRTMHIPLLSGRELREGDPFPGPVLVNQSFARQYFEGASPLGRSFQATVTGKKLTFTIAGVTGDARYFDMRESMRPTVYVAFSSPRPIFDNSATFVVRVSTADPRPLIPTLTARISRTRSAFRATEVVTQSDLIRQQTIRERVLAVVSLFFAIVAATLSAIGLYGVLSYSVLRRRRELGIRMALGARARTAARSVLIGPCMMLIPGVAAGLAGGFACQAYFTPLLYQTGSFDPRIAGLTVAMTAIITLAAFLPAIKRALGVDPSVILRAE